MTKKQCLICNCEKSMQLDEKKLSKMLGDDIGKMHMSLCRVQLESFETALQSGNDLIVACTQEAPLFQEIADENGAQNNLRFVNIRETAGWSKDGDKALPKITALLKDAEYVPNPVRLKSINSDGMCLVYGSGQQAFDIAKQMQQYLSVTLLLSDDEDIHLPEMAEIPIYRGDIVEASGSFGGFEVTVNNYAPLRPASKEKPAFAVARQGVKSNCSLILDLSGKTPLFTGHTRRDGYTHVDPRDPAACLRAAIKMFDMVGEFEKPIYVDYNAQTCAHSRSHKTGCNKCLDICPAGAITDNGDGVAIDASICGGCGSCHSLCPTGSISYKYPQRSDILKRVQSLLGNYLDAGGKDPVLLLHDEQYGQEMISAIARYGDGLPANVIPLGFHSVTTFGHVELLGMMASGATRVMFIANPQNQEELSGLESEIILANEILSGLKLTDTPSISIACERDPEKVEEEIWNLPASKPIKATGFSAEGSKREIARLVFASLHEASKAKTDIIALPEGSPYGLVEINQEACTLCMACTAACPASAIVDTPDEPKLRFTQSACVQCGLCVNTCPESALKLLPQLDFTPAAMQIQTLKEDEPFECISCGTPFAPKSTIERISNQLAGKHAMFADEERSNLIKMCDNCRVEAQANSSNDPFAVGAAPKPRTTEDYLEAEKNGLTADDFLMDD